MTSTAIKAAVLGLALAWSFNAHPARAAATEYFCVKNHSKTFQGLTMACYTDAGCEFVKSISGDPIRSYDVESVPYALGREKIEGIVTSSDAIIKKILGFGYACKKAG